MPQTHRSDQERSNFLISKTTENPQSECKWDIRARGLPIAQAWVGQTPANLDRPEQSLYHQPFLHSTPLHAVDFNLFFYSSLTDSASRSHLCFIYFPARATVRLLFTSAGPQEVSFLMDRGGKTKCFQT